MKSEVLIHLELNHEWPDYRPDIVVDALRKHIEDLESEKSQEGRVRPNGTKVVHNGRRGVLKGELKGDKWVLTYELTRNGYANRRITGNGPANGTQTND